MLHLIPPSVTNGSTADGRNAHAIFFHMRKCAGTSIREMFKQPATWALLPYCLPINKALSMLSGTAFNYTFWELHCEVRMQHLANTIAQARTRLLNRHSEPLHLVAFTSLRHPVDMALSDHEHFHHREPAEQWIRSNGDLLLFDKNYLGFPRPPSRSELNESACGVYAERTLRLLAPLDHIVFVDEPSSFSPIRQLASMAGGAMPALLHENIRCLHCHEQPNVTLSREASSYLEKRPWKLSRERAALRELAAKANWCSARIYAALRARRAAEHHWGLAGGRERSDGLLRV